MRSVKVHAMLDLVPLVQSFLKDACFGSGTYTPPRTPPPPKLAYASDVIAALNGFSNAMDRERIPISSPGASFLRRLCQALASYYGAPEHNWPDRRGLSVGIRESLVSVASLFERYLKEEQDVEIAGAKTTG